MRLPWIGDGLDERRVLVNASQLRSALKHIDYLLESLGEDDLRKFYPLLASDLQSVRGNVEAILWRVRGYAPIPTR